MVYNLKKHIYIYVCIHLSLFESEFFKNILDRS